MSKCAIMRDVSTMKNPSTEAGRELSEELKAKFKLALEGKLELPHCRDCIKSQNFVQVIEFLIPFITGATERIDRASQTMERFIEIFDQLEEKAMKDRFSEPEQGGEGR